MIERPDPEARIIERMARADFEAHEERRHGDRWEDQSEPVRQYWIDHARDVLTRMGVRVADTPAPDPLDDREPNPEAVRRIERHLLGEDFVNIKAAIESSPNGYTVVPKAAAATQPRPDPALDEQELTDIIEQAIFETDTGLEAAMLAAERILARLAGTASASETDT